jgi:hypothetical protein
MTVSELARNAGFGASASDKPAFLESVLSDFKGLRRHFRVSRIAHKGLNTVRTCYTSNHPTPATAPRRASTAKLMRPRRAHGGRPADPA